MNVDAVGRGIALGASLSGGGVPVVDVDALGRGNALAAAGGDTDTSGGAWLRGRVGVASGVFSDGATRRGAGAGCTAMQVI